MQLNSAGLPKSETQLKLDKIKERKKMLAVAEKEKHEKSSGWWESFPFSHLRCNMQKVSKQLSPIRKMNIKRYWKF